MNRHDEVYMQDLICEVIADPRDNRINQLMNAIEDLLNDCEEQTRIDGESVGYDWGYDQGHCDGYQSGFEEGDDEGYSRGQDDGYEAGYETGYESGLETGLDEAHWGREDD